MYLGEPGNVGPSGEVEYAEPENAISRK